MDTVNFPIKSSTSKKVENKSRMVDTKVLKLRMQKVRVFTIMPGAFDTPQFDKLEVLEIISVPLEYLFPSSFKGLKSLKNIRMQNMELVCIASFLVPCKWLEVIAVINCGPNPIRWKYLLGSVEYDYLSKIEIQHCRLIGTINMPTFSGLKNLREIRLNNDHIMEIEPRSFDGILRTLNSLNLDSNNLTTLPERIFRSRRRFSVFIRLEDNPWHCNNKLSHLRDFIKSHPGISNVICQSPPNLKGIILNKFDNPLGCEPLPTSITHSEETETIEREEPLTAHLQLEPELEPELVSFNNTLNLQCNIMTHVTLTKPSDGQKALFQPQNEHLLVDPVLFTDRKLFGFELSFWINYRKWTSYSIKMCHQKQWLQPFWHHTRFKT